MQIVECHAPRERRRFIAFIHDVYRGNHYYKDTLIGIVRTFLECSDTFTKSVAIRPLAVRSEGKTLAQCMLIIAPALPVAQVGFFEALPEQQDAVDLLLEEARTEARRRKFATVVVGLNGHLSYGVGILRDHFDAPISFDSLYNPAYYPAYFERQATDRHTLTTYEFDVANVRIDPRVLERLRRQFTFRAMNLRRFREEMLLFGELCNECLRHTRMYFDRDRVCLYELLADMRPFLRPEHLIFALKDGKPVGFVFWHPDLHEILPGGRPLPLWEIGLRYLCYGKRISMMKLNAVGVIPEYQRLGLAAGLVAEVHRYAYPRYSRGETNFVWDDNLPSTLFNRQVTDREFRHYAVYEFTA